jgi:hypothetical protein
MRTRSTISQAAHWLQWVIAMRLNAKRLAGLRDNDATAKKARHLVQPLGQSKQRTVNGCPRFANLIGQQNVISIHCVKVDTGNGGLVRFIAVNGQYMSIPSA